ncbi:MAG: hypothetical protein M1444_01855 [Patescibacteria group bacterium]|nr:hypothetical protein [Patescibacteria group bacterium]
MSTWKEKTQEELERIAGEAAQRAEDRANQALETETANQRLTEARLARIAELDTSLEIPRKLTEINEDVLGNLGNVDVGSLRITDKGASRQVVLNFSLSMTVEEKTEAVKKRRFGRHTESYRGEGPNGLVWEREWEETGWYDETVGYKTTGLYRVGGSRFPMAVLYSSPEPEQGKITIMDSIATLKVWDLKSLLGNNWRFTAIPKPYPYNFGENEPRFYNSDLSRLPGSYVEIVFPYDQRDSELLGAIIDNVLLQSCVARQRYVEGEIQSRADTDAKIRDIRSRIGQVK